jgi:NADH-quinone oxidoreductase subunit J
MQVTGLFFYLFSILAVSSALMVILARNPVHAVLFLILTFFNAAGLFILLGAEFLAMVLVIVYVGAVAVLFLFVVMMLDVDFAELKAGFIRNAPIGLLVGGVVLAELLALFLARSAMIPAATESSAAAATQAAGQTARTPEAVAAGEAAAATPPPPEAGEMVSNTEALGRVLYTDYAFFFEIAGLVLLVAMIGAIALTLHHREGVKRQSISEQVGRDPKQAMEVVKVAPGGAILPSSDDAT